MLRIITDFDGPIMDVSERYYRVYQFCLGEVRRPDQAVHCLSKAEFWRCKRAQVPEREIGRMSGLDDQQALEFARLRRETVHTLPYLSYDRPTETAIASLEQIQKAGIDLVVMTMRRVRELNHAFEENDLARFFPPDRRYCLPDDYVKTGDVRDKPLLMARAVAELPPASYVCMIGDTEADIAAAKSQGIPAIAVLSGIRDRDRLEQHAPDLIVQDLSEALDRFLDGALQSARLA